MKNDPLVLKHKTILIVDDELEITKALARQFKRKYTVLTATTALEALQILKTEEVQVIISDQRMPEMTGVEFFTSIKKTYPDIIKLILTGYSDIEATIAAINHGQVFRYITKPWNPDEINSIIVEAFDKYELIASNKDLIANLEEKVKIRTNELEEQKQNLELNQKELLEAEWKFKALFELGPIGVAYHKMIYDADGKASDYYFIDANESYKELTGVSPKGRTAREVFPGIENDPANWISVFGEVAKSGKTIRFEQLLEFNNRWYDCVAYQYKPNHFVTAFNETTKKKEIEIALIENEAKFRNIFEHSLVGKSITSLDGRLKVNVAFSNIVGYTEAELNTLNWKKITHPDDIAKNAEIVQSLLNGEKQSEYWQKRYIHKNGQIVWVDITTMLQRDSWGNAQFFITEISDITEQKFAQNILLKNERRYRALVENVEDLVLIVDVNGKINYASPAFERVTGFTLDEYQLFPTKDFVHPDDFNQMLDLWIESTNKPAVPIYITSRIFHKSGHWVWIEGYITNLIDDDSVNGIVANCRDISERKIAEGILAESERRFRDLLSSVQMISVVLDINGNIIFCNDYLLKLTNWTKDEIIGCNWFELFMVAEDYNGVFAIFDDIIKDTNLKTHNENKIKTKNGDELLISWNNTALYDENGNLNSIASIGIDITKQKLAEEALKKSQLMLSETEKIGHVGGWQYNIATASLSWTDETYIIHDLTPQQELTLEMGIAFYIPEYKTIIEDAVKRAIEFGEDFDLEIEILTAKNIRKYIHTIGRADLENERIYGFIQDISIQKEFELKLKESEHFFKESQKAAGIGSYKLDFINDKWSSSEVLDQIFGIEENYLRTVTGLVDIVYEDDKVKIKESFLQDVSSKNNSFDKDFRIKRISDGETRWVRCIGDLIFSDAYTPISMYGTVQDITLRKESEIELKIIKERNQDILETAMEGYWRVDKKGKILEINKSMSLMLGYSADELLNMNIADLELNESQLDVEKHIESTIAIGGHIFETQHRRKDGIAIDLEVSLQHLRNSDQVVAFFRDITERKRYTKALFESEKKFKLLYDKAPLSYQSLDKNACLLDVNETWLVTLGYSRNEVVGKPFANFMTPESAKLIEPRFKAFVENGEIHNHEFDMVKKDGFIIHVTYDGNIGYDDAGFFVQTHCIFQDITEKKKSELALAKSEARYGNLLQYLETGIVVHAPDTSIIMSNPKASELLGLSIDQMLGKLAIDPAWRFIDSNYNVLAPEEYPVNRIVKSKCASLNQILGVVTSANVDIVWLMVNGFPMLSENNEIIEVVISFNDITESKKAENELQESEERYRLIFEMNYSNMLIIDPGTGRIINANPAACSFYGWSYSELCNMNICDINILPNNQVIDNMNKAKQKSKEHFVFKHRKADGSICDVEVYSTAINFKKDTFLYVIIHDITERVFAENELRNSEEKYRRITDNINDVIWTSDLNLKINYVSPSVNRMLGLTEAEHIARPNKEKFPEKDFLQLRKILAEELENELDPNSDKNRSRSVELQYYKGDGTLIWVAIKVSFVRDREGKAIGLQGMTTDITVKKNAEIALAKSEERYRLISSVVSDYIFTSTLNENNELELSWVAGAFENITGYSFEEYKKIGGWRNSIHPDDLAKDDEDMAVLNQNKKVVTDLRTYKKNGDLVWVRVYAHPIWDESRNMLIGIYGGVKDITNSIIAENALKNSEEKFRKAFLTSPESITITSIETGVYKDVNNGFLQMIGYERNEAVGHSAVDLNIWYDIKDRDFLVRNIKEHGILENYVAKFRTKNGGIIYGMLSANIIELDGENYILIITRDITKIKKVEHALQETNERLNLILESSPIAIWDWDIENDVWYVTPKYYTMLGYEPESELPDRDVWINRVHPDDRAMVAEKINNVLNHGSETYKYDARMLHADGSYRWQTVIGLVINADAENNAKRMIGVRIDVHERKKAEQDLLEAKERAEKSEIFLHSIINNMGDPVFVKDDQSRLLLVNDAFCDVFGVEKDAVMFKSLAENVAADERESFLRIDKEVIETGIENISEETLTVIGFEKRIVSTKKTRFIDNNNIKYLVGIIRDMTDYKKVEDNLRKSEQLLQTVLDNFPGIIIWKDLESRYLGANVEFAKSAGFNTVDELIGLNDYDMPWSKTEAEKYRADDAFVMENNVSLLHMVENQHGADGSEIWLDTSKKPLTNYNGETIGVICVYTDITDKKLAEDALRESEAKLSAMFTSMTEMVVMHELIFDENGVPVDYRLIDCNESFSKLTAYRKEDVIGKFASDVYNVETAPYLQEYANVCITGESMVFRTYYKPLDKHFIISAVRLRENQFATITADITVIQKSQEAIADKNKELENYLYVASHDLRSPLVNIQGFSQRLQKQTTTLNNLLSMNNSIVDIQPQINKIIHEDVPKSVSFILSNIIKMETLISGLLQLSRTGRIAISIAEIDMNSLVKTILESFDFELMDIKAQVDLTALEKCYGDINQLTQLFSNIIGNAIKYRNKDINLKLEISSEIRFNKVIYAIKDNGIGIKDKFLSKIWDIFYRVDPMGNEQGEGIGLSIARKIVDKHLGRIWVESIEGNGSTFFIELQNKPFDEHLSTFNA